jgi:Pin2-interacting protein X1
VRGGLLVHEEIGTLADVKSNDNHDRYDGLHGQGEKSERAKKDVKVACKPIRPNEQDPPGDNDETAPSEDPTVKEKRNKSKTKKRKAHDVDGSEAGSSRKTSNKTIAAPHRIGGEVLPKSRVKEQRPMGRHIIRGRYIQQKKLALMDIKSLNEIFMIKS